MKALFNFIYQNTGWKTRRKLLLIASDDWGGARVNAADTIESLRASGITMDGNRFNKFDRLESNDDMELLFEVLLRHKDRHGNPAVITALTNVANPDFDRIREDGFRNFHYEKMTETLRRYPEHDRVYALYQQGIERRIFVPEFHGREHVHVARWMRALQAGHHNTRLAFDAAFFMLETKDLDPGMRSFGPAFEPDAADEVPSHAQIIEDGLRVFESLFGYKASLFTPPSLLYNHEIDATLQQAGIRLIDVKKFDKMPLGGNRYKTGFYAFGKKNSFGQKYIQRNAVFEPNQSDTDDTVASCLASVATAFRHGQPAIVSNHRVCFSGGIDTGNRDRSLKSLDVLLSNIIQQWPDVEFVTARQLADIMGA